ncbi:hypothetical protein Tco_0777016 [Tanacetum coccineum]
MSSPNRSTSNIGDAFSSMNILNYTSASSDYFPASAGSSSFNSSENPKENMILPVFSSFYNNPYPITSPAILTPSPVLPPSLLFDPRYFLVPEELLPPKKRIRSPYSSSTMLSNSSRNQTRNLVSPSSSVYTPTPPQIFEIGTEGHIDIMIIRRNSDKLKIELEKVRSQIIKLQKKQLGQKDKIAFAHYRISDLEQIIEKIQARHQTDQEDL